MVNISVYVYIFRAKVVDNVSRRGGIKSTEICIPCRLYNPTYSLARLPPHLNTHHVTPSPTLALPPVTTLAGGKDFQGKFLRSFPEDDGGVQERGGAQYLCALRRRRDDDRAVPAGIGGRSAGLHPRLDGGEQNAFQVSSPNRHRLSTRSPSTYMMPRREGSRKWVGPVRLLSLTRGEEISLVKELTRGTEAENTVFKRIDPRTENLVGNTIDPRTGTLL